MSAAIAARPPKPRVRHSTVPSFLFAVLMHGVLFAMMWFAVQWKTSPDAPAQAELWTLPALNVPPPPPAPVVETPPVVEPAPPPKPVPEPERPNADIVEQQEKKKREEKKLEEQRLEEKKLDDEKKRLDEEYKKAEARKADLAKKEQARKDREAEERRNENLARLESMAGPDARPAAGPARVDAGYAAMVRACIRPHIAFNVPDGTAESVYAEFVVELLPTGEQGAPPRLVKPSGLPGYDAAAERAIRRCDPFPRPPSGRVQSSMVLTLRPTETR